MLSLFDDNKVKVARKLGKNPKENPVGALGKVKDENREDKTGTVCI